MFDFQFDFIIKALPALWDGALVTAKVSSLSFILALVIGIIVGVARAEVKCSSFWLGTYVEIFRGTPLLIQLFFIYYGLPSIGVTMDAFTAAIIGLSLNGGAYISEVVRASFSAIPIGQREAAQASGLSWRQTVTYVILPQAMRISIPPLMNIFSNMLKESSLVSVLAITELARVGQLVYTKTFRAFEIYLTVGIIYFCMIFLISRLSRIFERRYPSNGFL